MSGRKPVNRQVVVIFGASSGIGRASALLFARKGATVVAAARSDEGLDTLVHEIGQSGGEITALVADATHFEDVKRVADTAVSRYGRIDTWVHCAAVTIYATFADTTVEEFRQIVDTNLFGTIHAAKAALPYLAESHGTFVPVTSVEALVALPFQSAYSASKHAVHGFLQALRLELTKAGSPVRVAEIQPVSTDTALFEKAKTKLGVQPQGLPPVHAPEKVAEVIVHAAVHPSPEIPVGAAGRLMGWGARMAPRATEAVLEVVGFAGQKSAKPKSADAPNNLYRPLPETERVHGEQKGLVVASSLLPWLFAGVAVGAAFALASRSGRSDGASGTPPPTSNPSDSLSPSRYIQTAMVQPRRADTINANEPLASLPGPDGPELDPEYQGS